MTISSQRAPAPASSTPVSPSSASNVQEASWNERTIAVNRQVMDGVTKEDIKVHAARKYIPKMASDKNRAILVKRAINPVKVTKNRGKSPGIRAKPIVSSDRAKRSELEEQIRKLGELAPKSKPKPKPEPTPEPTPEQKALIDKANKIFLSCVLIQFENKFVEVVQDLAVILHQNLPIIQEAEALPHKVSSHEFKYNFKITSHEHLAFLIYFKDILYVRDSEENSSPFINIENITDNHLETLEIISKIYPDEDKNGIGYYARYIIFLAKAHRANKAITKVHNELLDIYRYHPLYSLNDPTIESLYSKVVDVVAPVLKSLNRMQSVTIKKALLSEATQPKICSIDHEYFMDLYEKLRNIQPYFQTQKDLYVSFMSGHPVHKATGKPIIEILMPEKLNGTIACLARTLVLPEATTWFIDRAHPQFALSFSDDDLINDFKGCPLSAASSSEKRKKKRKNKGAGSQRLSPSSESSSSPKPPEASLTALESIGICRRSLEDQVFLSSQSFKYHPRVQRWNIVKGEIQKIRGFRDHDLCPYKGSTDRKLQEQLIYHNFSRSVDKILALNESRDNYAIKTDTGFMMVAYILSSNGVGVSGIITYGVDQDSETCYHRHFTPFENSPPDISSNALIKMYNSKLKEEVESAKKTHTQELNQFLEGNNGYDSVAVINDSLTITKDLFRTLEVIDSENKCTIFVYPQN